MMITIYATEEDSEKIKSYCDKTNQKISSFLIRLALKEITENEN